MSIESKDWRIYERKIHEELEIIYGDCEFEFDDRIFGKFSKIDRQIDISIRGQVGGNKILGIVDCKYFSSKIDVKIVESFLGMLEDVKANFGLIITNKGFSKAAKNRAQMKNVNLEIIEFDKIQDAKISIDYFFNKKIKSLELSRYEFYKRCEQNWSYFDKENSSYQHKVIAFKEGWARTEYFAFKRIITASARIFRDFTDLDRITIRLIATRNDQSTNWIDEKRIYSSLISRDELEKFLNLNFSELREEINTWRTGFIENDVYSKETVLEYAGKYIDSESVNR